MKRNREELEKQINYTITKMHEDTTIDKIKELAVEKLDDYFPVPRIIQIFNKSVLLPTLSELDLYNIAMFLNDVNELNVRLEDYYTETEMKEAIIPRVMDISEYDYESTFEDVLFNGDELNEQYILILPYTTIARMHEASVFQYNFATQRRANIVKYKNRSVREAMINMKSVEEIKKEVLKGTFQTNTITLNIRKTGTEDYDYSPQQKKLIVKKKGTCIDIIDGYHRTTAIHLAWKENPNIKGNMIVSIKNLTVEEARFFISQEAKGNINNQLEVKLYDPNSNVARLIRDINNNSNPSNILCNRISDGNDNRDVLVYYETFSSNLLAAWDGKLDDVGALELMQIKDFICNVYAGIYELLMKHRKVKALDELDSEDIILDHMFISGILYIARKLYDEDNGNISVDKIKKVASKIINKIESEKESSKLTYDDEKNTRQVGLYKKAWASIV